MAPRRGALLALAVSSPCRGFVCDVHRSCGPARPQSSQGRLIRMALVGKGATRGEMGYRKLGDSELLVSQVCIGGMMFGLATDEASSHKLLDLAVDGHGANFIDTAEAYPYPADVDTAGVSERIIGSWLKGRDRSSVVMATKVCSAGNTMPWMREEGGETALTRKQVAEAVDASLRRLGTDYIDLLQIGWPSRYTLSRAEECYNYGREEDEGPGFEEQLMALQGVIEAGKVRYIGVVDETPMGVLRFCEYAAWDELPKIVSVQNEYNLLARNRVELGEFLLASHFAIWRLWSPPSPLPPAATAVAAGSSADRAAAVADSFCGVRLSGLIEACAPKNSNVGLLAHSPLAGGALTAKYLGQRPLTMDRGVRLNKFTGWQARYLNDRCQKAVAEYAGVAAKHGLPPGQLALAWLLARSHVASTVVGATSELQMAEAMGALAVDVTSELEADVHAVFSRFREPSLGLTFV